MPACHAGDRRFESGRVRHHPHFPTPRPPARTGRSSVLAAQRLGGPAASAAHPADLCHTPPRESTTRSRSPPVSSSLRSWRCWPRRSWGSAAGPRRRPRRSPGSSGDPQPGRRRPRHVVPSPPTTTAPTPDPSAERDAGDPSRARRDRRRRRSCRSPSSAPPRLPRIAKDVAAILAGTSDTYDALALVKAEAPAILAALGRGRRRPGPYRPASDDEQTLAADLAKNRKRLAFLRADAVGPGVRALDLAGQGAVRRSTGSRPSPTGR